VNLVEVSEPAHGHDQGVEFLGYARVAHKDGSEALFRRPQMTAQAPVRETGLNTFSSAQSKATETSFSGMPRAISLNPPGRRAGRGLGPPSQTGAREGGAGLNGECGPWLVHNRATQYTQSALLGSRAMGESER
jgi:hypothetical protein